MNRSLCIFCGRALCSQVLRRLARRFARAPDQLLADLEARSVAGLMSAYGGAARESPRLLNPTLNPTS